MEVILRETVESLGRRGEIVKVATGYARNYLLPRKLALPVTEANKRQVERERRVADAREADELRSAEALAARIATLECVLARRVGETETLYGSVTSADLAEWLAKQQIEVDRRRIQLGEPIKHLGEQRVPIKLHRDVVAQLQVRVVKQADEGSPQA